MATLDDSRGEYDFNQLETSTIPPAKLAQQIEKDAIKTFGDRSDEFIGIMPLGGNFYRININEETFVIVGPPKGKWSKLWSAIKNEDYDLFDDVMQQIEDEIDR